MNSELLSTLSLPQRQQETQIKSDEVIEQRIVDRL